MSILMEGVGMPKSCYDCKVRVACEAYLNYKDIHPYSIYAKGRLADCPLTEMPQHVALEKPRIGKWAQQHGYATPGGTPVFVCPNCGASEHLYGAEYPKRKVVCDKCGQVNVYPWEQILEDGEYVKGKDV